MSGGEHEPAPGSLPSLPEGDSREGEATAAGKLPRADADGVFVLRGRVLLPEGQGAAGARVSLRWGHLAVPPVEWPEW